MKSDFSSRAHDALNNPQLRRNFRRAMDGLMSKRAVQFADQDDWAALRARGAAIKARALARLPDLLEEFERKATANGIIVHWAETTADANSIVLDILTAHGAKRVIKGKSMVSEEMHLNAHLEAHGITAVESDLGEYIIQLAGEAPSHIVMPCIHKNKGEIAQLFTDNIAGQPYTEDVDALTAAARKVLRREFANADAGLSGANFLVAETGSLVLIENEGNGRLSTTLPPLHIAVTGIEKLVEKLDDVAPLLALLPRSATGQPITTYVNMITSPRKEGEKDGPRQVHLVLLDNGRSRVYADLQLRDTLRCIRCGACMNHCPVYARVGGHTYGSVYPGPIGKILTPQLAGLDCAGDLPHASTLCNACVEVCPVQIPIADILVRLRTEAAQPSQAPGVKGAGSNTSMVENAVWRGWQAMNSSPAAYAAATRSLAVIGNLIPAAAPLLKQWTSVRSKPKFAGRTLHQLARDKGYENE
ncbi:putative amino acid dehydrogenase containing NAD(P)-binding domain and ferridoxin-like domain [Magnetospirillum gryphiswaldense MSR-1 v2]|uniref:Amino acid dehydrogenase containing NAD(P)-binding domain and ferridoxin-like domain n=1 Tax=Magnetospirillum gryphiswaldense (strain DSM 6361 / JCM 21280 / NBRC 15271 / MSR-1) TaxID=431944 RepID=V6F410_MAGGM|nr:LutB/LldF family L-lactate oxidation iron-sulfur protein [Magnetospirillum gryphiswaldense]CDK99026.1 putative amino acid dehydrogenase containing NAD(P)-binding domain and ferridoxin-like domain [Magnetospirillum gryphiswaldense MSR-1 v2]